MNENMTCNLLRSACSTEWVTKTYAEYLLTCSKDLAEIDAAIASAAMDQRIEEACATAQESYDEVTGLLSQYVYDWCVENDQPVTIQEEAMNSPDYIHLVQDMARLHASELSQKMDSLLPELPGDLDAQVAYLLSTPEDQVLASRPIVDQAVTEIATEIFSQGGYIQDARLNLQSGCFALRDVIKQGILHTQLFDATDEFVLESTDMVTDLATEVTMNYPGLMDELHGACSSAMIWAYGMLAAAQTTCSDRVTAFQGYTQDLNERIDSVRGSIASVKAALSTDITNSVDMFNYYVSLCDVDGIQLHQVHSVQETPMSEFTGASPWSAVDFHSAKSVAVYTGVAVAAVAVGIVNVAKTLLSKAVSKLKPALVSIAGAVQNNPYDIKTIDANAQSYTFDRWTFGRNEYTTYLAVDNEEAYTKISSKLSRELDQWFAINSVFGEVLLKVHSIELVSENPMTSAVGHFLKGTISYQFKPRVLNVQYLLDQGIIASTTNGGDTYVYFPQWAASAASQSDVFSAALSQNGLYLDDSAPEYSVYNGLRVATMCMANLLYTATTELVESSDSGGGYVSGFVWFTNLAETGFDNITFTSYARLPVYLRLLPSSAVVTNRDLVFATCGYDDSSTYVQPQDRFDILSYHILSGQTMAAHSQRLSNLIGPLFFSTMGKIFADRVDNPGTSIFVPYSTSNYTFDEPRYSITTDSQNANVATAIAGTLIVIVIAATIGFQILRIVRLHKRNQIKRYAAWQAEKGRMDNAMWNSAKGYTLDWKDAKRYRKLTKKISKYDNLSLFNATVSAATNQIKDAALNTAKAAASYAVSAVNVSSSSSKTSIEQYIYRAITGKLA